MTRLIASSWLFFTQALAASFMYRVALFQMMLGESISCIAMVYFWQLAAAGQTNMVGGYQPAQLVMYFLFSSFHHLVQETSAARDLSTDIRMGKLASSLLRPYPYVLVVLLRTCAQVCTRLLLIGPVVIALVWAIPTLRAFVTHLNLEVFVMYGAALAIMLLMGWGVRIAIGLLAFDMTQTWGPELMLLATYVAFSGAQYPSDLLPEMWYRAVTWTPLYYLQGFPNLVITGRLAPGLFWGQVLQAFILLGVVWCVIGLMWKRGLRKFEAIGI